MSHKTDRKRAAKLEALYARLPTVACRGLCAEACGPVPMTTFEAVRLRRADPRHRWPMVVLRNERPRCCYLTDADRCGVYDVRPLVCRVWGTVKRLSCMHGCTPDRWLTDHEFAALAQAAERLGGALVVSDLGALRKSDQSFFDLDASAVSPEFADHWAEVVRGLRALHGGRIVGAAPDGPGGFVNVDPPKRD
jgi:Fe-S-cluster containining protein